MRYINLYLIVFFTGISLSVEAQTEEYKNINKEIRAADEAYHEGDFLKAYRLYDNLSKKSPDDETYFNYMKASCLIYLDKDAENSLAILENSKESLGQSDMAIEYYYHLGESYHLNLMFDSAINAFNNCLANPNLIEQEERAVIEYKIGISKSAKAAYDLGKKYPVRKLDSTINTIYEDYKPVISADEDLLIFTSKRAGSTGGKVDDNGKYFEDIYLSKRNPYGFFEEAKKISANINTDDHEASVGLSVDGRQLIIYKGANNGGSLYLSVLEGNDWGIPFLIDNGETINSKKAWETSASISADEKTIYFTSDRTGGLGGLDIYMAKKLTNGNWGTPVNIGNTVNTTYDEESPFIHPDGKTLYFSSKGHDTYGGFDIFRTTLLEDGSWSKPENIGFPVSTVHNDVHFVLTADGKKGYFSSSRNNKEGCEDLYSVILDEDIKPLILVKGIIKSDAATLKTATIDIIDKVDNTKQKYVYNPNPTTGKYLMILPPGRSYSMLVDAEGFETYQIDINIPNQTHFHEFYQEITLSKIRDENDSLIEEVVVVNSFDNLRDNKDINPNINHPNTDYLESLVYDIVNLTDSSKNKDFDAEEILKNKLNKVETLTDNVTENFANIIENKAYTETLTFRSNYLRDQKLEQLVLDGDTLDFIPFSAFESASSPVAVSTIKNNNSNEIKEGTKSSDSTKKDELAVNNTSKTDTEQNQNTPSTKGTEPVGSKSNLESKSVTVYFDFAKSDLTEVYKKQLKDLTVYYKGAQATYLLEGHTDAMGSDAYNIALSKKRTQAVLSYLSSLGVKISSTNIKNFGENKPAVPNTMPDGSDNPSGRQLNRRAVVTVTIP